MATLNAVLRRHSAGRIVTKAPSRWVDDMAGQWDNPTMIVTLDEKRRLTIPVALAPASPGDAFDAQFDADEDTIVFRRVKRVTRWLEVMKACPVSMDDLPPRSREYVRKRRL